MAEKCRGNLPRPRFLGFWEFRWFRDFWWARTELIVAGQLLGVCPIGLDRKQVSAGTYINYPVHAHRIIIDRFIRTIEFRFCRISKPQAEPLTPNH